MQSRPDLRSPRALWAEQQIEPSVKPVTDQCKTFALARQRSCPEMPQPIAIEGVEKGAEIAQRLRRR